MASASDLAAIVLMNASRRGRRRWISDEAAERTFLCHVFVMRLILPVRRVSCSLVGRRRLVESVCDERTKFLEHRVSSSFRSLT